MQLSGVFFSKSTDMKLVYILVGTLFTSCSLLSACFSIFVLPPRYVCMCNFLGKSKQTQVVYMHLNLSSSYTTINNYIANLLSSMKIKPKIIGISESRLQINKQSINNISLPNYVYEHTPCV